MTDPTDQNIPNDTPLPDERPTPENPAPPEELPSSTPEPAPEPKPEPEPAQPSAAKPAAPPRKFKTWFIVILLLPLLLAGAGVGIGTWQVSQWGRQPFGVPGVHPIKIPAGTPTREIGHLLKTEGIISDATLFYVWLALQRQRYPIQAGEHKIKTPIAPCDLVLILRHGAFERPLTIPEGWTAARIADRLVRDRWIRNPAEWLDLVAQPQPPEAAGIALPHGAEGFLFPETYRLEAGTRPAEILGHMLTRFRHEWEKLEPARRDPRSADLTTTQVVVLASMIEREARTPAEMPQIASVYLNRLKKKMKLECCATVRYALGGVWDRPLLFADLKVDSPYNTYKHPGLPPGAIANPGRDALAAVLRPAATDFLFYVYAGNNHHVFSRTYTEHMKAVRAVRTKNPKETVTAQSED